MKTLLLITIIMSCMSTFAAKWQHVKIEFSDGEKYQGKLSVMGIRPVTICPSGSKYQQKILLKDILTLRQVVKEAKMNRPWLYKEAGKVEKMYLEGKYPFINLETEILLTNGKVIRGDIVSAAFRFKGKGPKKIFLTRQIKGKVGEKMDDVIYPVKFTFDNEENIVEPIWIKLTNGGKITRATALDNEREIVRFGKIEGDKITFNNLFDADYDIFILTDDRVLFGLSNSVPSSKKGKSLPSDASAKINKKFPLADDFFNDRWILDLKGNTSFCKTLVYKRRAKYYHAHKHTPGGWMWHLDIWSWHLAGEEWKIDRRYIMIRHKQKGKEKIRSLYSVKALEAVKPGSDIEIDLNKGKNNGIKFIQKLK